MGYQVLFLGKKVVFIYVSVGVYVVYMEGVSELFDDFQKFYLCCWLGFFGIEDVMEISVVFMLMVFDLFVVIKVDVNVWVVVLGVVF